MKYERILTRNSKEFTIGGINCVTKRVYRGFSPLLSNFVISTPHGVVRTYQQKLQMPEYSNTGIEVF